MSDDSQTYEDLRGDVIELKNEAFSKKDEAVKEVEEKKTEFLQALEDDGVVNPKGLSMAGFGAVFIAAIPLTSFLAQPNGLLEKLVNAVCSGVMFIGTAGSSHAVSDKSKIAALSTLYLATTYAFSGAASVGGVMAASKEGRDNNHPRAQTRDLRGLPLRLYSAHYHLMEKFPGFALAAALAQTMAPGDRTLVNLLGLHVVAKVFVHYPMYILNMGAARSIGHVVATSAIINVAWKLARRAN